MLKHANHKELAYPALARCLEPSFLLLILFIMKDDLHDWIKCALGDTKSHLTIWFPWNHLISNQPSDPCHNSALPWWIAALLATRVETACLAAPPSPGRPCCTLRENLRQLAQSRLSETNTFWAKRHFQDLFQVRISFGHLEVAVLLWGNRIKECWTQKDKR